jgi:anthranilate synthase component 1
MVHAIIIRSFETKNNVITCQAGAGIVAASDEIKEKDEVNNKLAALKKATAAFSALKNKNYERNFTNR